MSQVSMQGEYNNNNSISNKLHIKKKMNIMCFHLNMKIGIRSFRTIPK